MFIFVRQKWCVPFKTYIRFIFYFIFLVCSATFVVQTNNIFSERYSLSLLKFIRNSTKLIFSIFGINQENNFKHKKDVAIQTCWKQTNWLGYGGVCQPVPLVCMNRLSYSLSACVAETFTKPRQVARNFEDVRLKMTRNKLKIYPSLLIKGLLSYAMRIIRTNI